MACKTCGDPNIDQKYNCHKCDVKQRRYKWCVITKIPPNGAICNDFIDFNREQAKEHVFRSCNWLGGWIKSRQELVKMGPDKYSLPVHGRVFRVGEMFPIGIDFEREFTGLGRKPSKWDVEYELFHAKDVTKAMLRAMEIRDAET